MPKSYLNSTIFLLEDNAGDAYYTCEILEEIGFKRSKIHVVGSMEELSKLIPGIQPQVLLLDLFVKDSNGFDTYERVQQLLPHVPIIVLSGIPDKEIALNTVKSGAQDFIIKGEFDENTLHKSIIYAIERKKNVDQIAESRAKYEQFFMENPLPMFIIDGNDFSFQMVNKAAVKLFGYSLEEFGEMKLSDLFNGNEFFKKTHLQLIMGKIAEFECYNKNKDLLYLEINSQAITMNQNNSFVLYANNITEKKFYEIEKLRLINETQAYERNRFSMELHDGLGQHLIALNFFLSQLSESEQIDQGLMDSCFEIINISLNQTRALCYNLTPPELEFGLLSAINAMFGRMNSLGKIKFKLLIDEQISDSDFTNVDTYNLYRMIQEFVNNSIKHAKASEISCSITRLQDEIKFEIKDNGTGFDMDQVKSGLGLKNFEKRSKLLNLDFQINSTSRGTVLSFLSPKN